MDNHDNGERRYKRYLENSEVSVPRSTKHYRTQTENEAAEAGPSIRGTVEQETPYKNVPKQYKRYLSDSNVEIPRQTKHYRVKTQNPHARRNTQSPEGADEHKDLNEKCPEEESPVGNLPSCSSTGDREGTCGASNIESDDDSAWLPIPDTENSSQIYYGLLANEEETEGASFPMPDIESDESSDASENGNERQQDDFEEDFFQERWENPLYTGASVTLGQTILILMALVLTSGLTQETLSQLLSVLQVILPADSILPTTKYLFNKYFDTDKYNINVYCPDCCYLLQNEKCDICEKTWCKKLLYKDQHYFITSELIPQFRHVLQTLNLGHLLSYRDDRSKIANCVSDMYDGKMYKDMCEKTKLGTKYSFSLTFNSDGIPVFKSSSFSIWPILSFINEFPPDVRKKHMFLNGLWFGKNKPNVNIFVKKFTSELKMLASKGFEWVHNGKKIVSYVYCIICSCDSVARPIFQNLKQFNGKYGCNWCLHPGTRVEKNKGTAQVYDFKEEIEFRNHDDTVTHGRTAHQQGYDIFGVKGPSIFILLPNFNIVDGFVVDYMHCVDLGISRYLASLWFDSVHHADPWYIGTKIKQIDSNMFHFHPPKNITRLPRSITQRAYWKASEWRSFALFYGPISLKSILPTKFFQHFLLFCNGIFILQKESIHQVELCYAHNYLTKFVSDFEELYGLQHMTFNLHMLTHITESVRNWGPLWCFSAYAFESFNGVLLKMFHGTQAVPVQIFKSFLLLRSIEAKSISTFNTCNENVKTQFGKMLDGYSHVTKATRCNGSVLFGTGRIKSLTVHEQYVIERFLQIGVNENACFFYKIHVNDQIFQSMHYVRCQNRNNSCVKIDDKFYQIENFVKVTCIDESVHVLCIVCPFIVSKTKKVGAKCALTGSHLSHISYIDDIDTNGLCCISANQLKHKLIMYDFQNEKAICVLPNCFERD